MSTTRSVSGEMSRAGSKVLPALGEPKRATLMRERDILFFFFSLLFFASISLPFLSPRGGLRVRYQDE